MSTLTEDRSSILDDTLPSIFEEDEEETEEEKQELTSSSFLEWDRNRDELYAVSTPPASMRKKTTEVFGSGEGLGLSFDASFPSPFRLDGLGLLSSYHPEERVGKSTMGDEGLDLGLSSQFLHEISYTFVGAPSSSSPRSTSTPRRETSAMIGKGRGNGGVGAATISSVNKRTSKVDKGAQAGPVWR
jgi:hypothetical protein